MTIGAYKTANGQDNLIIDGQQRLTSILLAYIERFHKKEAGTGNIESLANENDDDSDEDEQENMIEWTFKELLDTSRKEALEEELKKAVRDIKDNNSLHAKSPAYLKYLRERISKSIGIYQKYLNRP